MTRPVQRLREILEAPGLVVMPCCFDALSARLVEQAGFPVSFMSGFAVAATQLGMPDTGLASYAEVVAHGRNLCGAVSIPVIGDADTGYGNPANVRRTTLGYAAAGFAGMMIEDQVAPKRCGHTRGKQVVDRAEALRRVRAALDAREEAGDLVLVARTDARATLGLDEAIERGRAFARLGADVVFVEAPATVAELERVAREVPGPKLVNLVEGGDTPVLPIEHLDRLGYKLAAYPLTLLSTAARAMQDALGALRDGTPPDALLEFEELQRLVGFDDYDAFLERYRGDD